MRHGWRGTLLLGALALPVAALAQQLPRQWEVEVTRLVDGDTLDVSIALGFDVTVAKRVRIAGIDTPETYGVKKGSPEHMRGMAAKTHTAQWLKDCAPYSLTVEKERGKYGRVIGDLVSERCAPLSESLLLSGNARRVQY